MIHDYDAQSSIELPRTDAGESVTVGHAILAVYKAQKKPAANVAAVARHVEARTATLQHALFSSEQAGGDPTYLGPLRASSAAWSAAYTWLKPITKVSNAGMASAARHILEVLYPNGVRFVRLAIGERWLEAEKRVQAIAEKRLHGDFATLGGSAFLTDILSTHKTLGNAAGITAPRGVATKSGVQPSLDLWKAAIRAYIAQVMANESAALLENPDDEAATELAERLLEPLTRIETTRAAPAEKSGEGTGSGETAESKAAEKKPEAPATPQA